MELSRTLSSFPSKYVFWSYVCSLDEPEAHPTIEQLLRKSSSGETFLNRVKVISTTSREAVERLTRGQSKNPLWHQYRRYFITGSKVHMLKNVARLSALSSRSRDLIIGAVDEGNGSDKLQYIPAISYGRAKEPVAKMGFIARYHDKLPNFKFYDRGLMMDSQHPFIAASVDGLYEFDDLEL